ncbi:MAG: phage protease [Candidatus Accumulibacter sp.]|uniref:phage protease n=1 Tax=Accumulibacter sp. TaxID=2053492 RepID=UPI00258B7E11|nr:phage protease [Accumulibacter sp.]MCM8622333.1 phage protease [Accumulibacter sp.]
MLEKPLVSHCSTLALGDPVHEFRLIPAGLFSATDGRPNGLPGWRMSRASALEIIHLAAARVSDFVIDYEHQSLNSPSNGKPNPAAGWFKRLEWREGDGLYVTDARWTERAAAMIRAKEYRFISPVFYYDHKGEVLGVVSAALTNTPALDGLTELAAASRILGQGAGHSEIASAAIAYQEAMARNGVFLTTVQAVNRVSPNSSHQASARLVVQDGLGESRAQRIAAAALSYQKDRADIGVHVTTLQAVHHVQPSIK